MTGEKTVPTADAPGLTLAQRMRFRTLGMGPGIQLTRFDIDIPVGEGVDTVPVGIDA